MDNVYQRRKTRTVFVGQVGVGGNNPIRIQSMCTSDTKNTSRVIREIEGLAEAGCEIIRVTVPTKADCENLKNIRSEMAKRNLKTPLVADIHFTPSIAMDVVDFVEKVRINPGNFVDKKLFKTREYTDQEYADELKHIEEKFAPLVLKCKEKKVAMRIGTNHGSLSDRIMNRYGDTPEGMVESALEFMRIAMKNDFHDIILSMKASNPQVMITAYRLLAKRMDELGMNYPFHLGVTEAGDGEDGRIKSALGIGTLLEEGIGDTIRVSLTEDSVYEVPVAYKIAASYNYRFAIQEKKISPDYKSKIFPLQYQRRLSARVHTGDLNFGEKELIPVWTKVTPKNFEEFLKSQNVDMRFEGVEIEEQDYSQDFADRLRAQNFAVGIISKNRIFLKQTKNVQKLTLIGSMGCEELVQICEKDKCHLEICLDSLQQVKDIVNHLRAEEFSNFSFSLNPSQPFWDYRKLLETLKQCASDAPLHLRYQKTGRPTLLDASTQLGGLFIDGIGDSIQIDGDFSFKEKLTLSYGILQASRVRISKTEFIACPSCGRTLFDLQDVTAKIKSKTSHLKGVKIAIMGCIVNGPGEMADADFGYVGTGTGKISLYVGKECVQRNIPETNALEELITLIQKHNLWVEPKEAA